jgi:amino acid adenylation domain-containing protein
MSVLFELLRAAATDQPRRPALACDGGSLSYEELLDVSLRMAAALRSHGLQPAARVAIWAPKRIETYAGVYAALAAGAVYVPIDMTAPPARAAWIVADASAEVLVCRRFDFQQLPRPLPAGLRLVVLLDGEAPAEGGIAVAGWKQLIAARRGTEESVPERALAYILYTSGSTGTPKGVAISHAAARAFVDWAGDLCELRPTDRVSNHSSLSFDLSVFDLFATARSGAALLPVPQSPAAEGYGFARFIARQGITVWYSVPTLLDRIAASQETRPLELGSLRLVAFAGEVFPKPRLVHCRTVLPRPRLLNWYGPTETNVCLSHEVTPADVADEGPLPIGTPCPYAEIFLRQVEDGLGELLVAGASLMQGYWRKGEVDCSILVETGVARSYPTGDLASLGADGSYRFHGRRDSQVKLRGYRVELGEIEEALADLPYVHEAAVVCSGEALFAFVGTNQDPALGACEEETRSHLSRVLPAYMLPQRIQLCPSLPRTDRGKIDRRALLLSLVEEGLHA